MTFQNQPLVSIVTPAHNEEQYIRECIESFLAQTYTNWHCVIVNNCSTDGTLELVLKFAEKDRRIQVVNNDALLPAVANFNRALRLISPDSKYCKMVLADDWMFPECLEHMVGVMEANPSIGITGAYGLQDGSVLWQGLRYGNSLHSGREVCRERLLGGSYIFGSQTSVLYRSDLVRSRENFFNESNAHGADSETCFELLKDSDFGFVFQVLTYSRERPNSMLQASRQVNTSAADLLTELRRFGPYFLSPRELHDRFTGIVQKYYEFLATNLFRARGKPFWEFHKRRLRDEGVTFSYASLVGGLARKVAERFRIRPKNQPKWGL